MGDRKLIDAYKKLAFNGRGNWTDVIKSLKESVNEKISKEEWAEYPKYARKLKPYMKRLLKVPVKVRVIKQANHKPWIEVRVARFGKDIIPNDFRKRALKVIGGRARENDRCTSERKFAGRRIPVHHLSGFGWASGSREQSVGTFLKTQ